MEFVSSEMAVLIVRIPVVTSSEIMPAYYMPQVYGCPSQKIADYNHVDPIIFACYCSTLITQELSISS